MGGFPGAPSRRKSENRKYPIQRFQAFWSVTERYAELTKSDPLIHTNVAAAVTDLGVET
jgi:hypothetical protein